MTVRNIPAKRKLPLSIDGPMQFQSGCLFFLFFFVVALSTEAVEAPSNEDHFFFDGILILY